MCLLTDAPACLLIFVFFQAAYASGYDSLSSAPTLSEAQVSQLVAFASREPPSAVEATVRMQAAYDVALVSVRTASESSRRSRERRCEDAITALCSALDAAGSAGAAASAGGPRAANSTDLPATPATVAALSNAHHALVEFSTAFVSVDPAAAGVAPAASARASGGGSIDLPSFVAASSRECMSAIESVFPRSAIASLRGLSREDLAAHAGGVARLSLGARLFNWNEGRGGLGLEHVPSAAVTEVESLSKDVAVVLRSTSASAASYVDVWAAAAAGQGVAEAVTSALAATCTQSNEEEWPAELANRRALAVLAAALADELRARKTEAAEALNAWSGAIGALQRTVRGASTVSKDSVFPLFADLADAWIRAASVRSSVAGAAAIFRSILPYSAPQVCTLPDAVGAQAASALGPTARSRAAETLPIVELTSATGQTAQSIPLDSPDAPSFLDTPLALQGFCPVALATPPPRLISGTTQITRGVLLPGDPNHGVLIWRNAQYIASSARAAAAFMAAPEAYVSAALAAARASPDLIHLLQILAPAPEGFSEVSLPALAEYDGDLAVAAGVSNRALGPEAAAPVPLARTNRLGATVSDAGVSTPVHFIERHIDPRYSFSEWTLRRQALALANVRKCVTHSAQTDGSHFRRDNDSQVYLPRTSGTQTGIDAGTSTDKEPIQIVRVRGGKEPFVEAAAQRVAAGLPALP